MFIIPRISMGMVSDSLLNFSMKEPLKCALYRIICVAASEKEIMAPYKGQSAFFFTLLVFRCSLTTKVLLQFACMDCATLAVSSKYIITFFKG